jgi:hypothetical protein
LVFNLKYEHAISFIKLVKFINYYQMPRSISSKLFVIASGGGEANVYDHCIIEILGLRPLLNHSPYIIQRVLTWNRFS